MLLGALVVLAVAGAGHAANSATFQDSTGEDAQGPDVTTIRLANDNRGAITFTVNVPNRPTLTGDMYMLIFLDTDANPATGEPDIGSDYAIQLLGPLTGQASVGLFRWNGSEYTAAGVAQSSLIFSYANGAATIRINAAELGATKKFSFVVLAVTGVVLGPDGEPDDTNARFDAAPDAGHGLYSYDVKTAPPSLVVRSFRSSPAKPRAGRRYTVSAVVARSDTGAAIQSGRVTCTASIAGRPLRGTPALVRGRASCAFAIPASASGKTIRGSMRVVSQGVRAGRSFSAKIA